MGEDDEELDLDQALDALDLDINFLESDDFDVEDDAKESTPETTSAAPASLQKVEQPAVSNKPEWADRTEIHSRHFKPCPKEREELEAIATKLGVKSNLPKSGPSGFVNPLDTILGAAAGNDDESDPHNPQSQWNRLVNGKATRQTQQLPVSIVLMRGTVMYKDIVNEQTGETVSHHGCELILLTRGFLLVQKEESSSFFGKKQETYVPLGSALWTDVEQLQTTAYQSLKITCADKVQFDVLPAQDFQDWKIALETAATRSHFNFNATVGKMEKGWQYKICQTPWFTEAVTGEWNDLGLEMATTASAAQLDQLDDYNSYAPLHYATRHNHLEVIRRLLEAGANPNIENGEGHTPMYYAERDQLPTGTVAVLKQFGAVPSRKAEEEMRGELFGKVNITNQAREEKREAEAAAAKAAQEKAATAQSQMAQNLNAMHKRGELIEDLGNKATELQDGAQDYSDMAAQLKAKMKKKSVWGF